MAICHEPVHVIGASGRCGQAVCRALIQRGTPVVALVRDRAKWQAPGLLTRCFSADSSLMSITSRVVDMTGPKDTLRTALADATRIICTAHARHIPALLAASPHQARLVCLGSTRKFTHWPDDHARGVREGERAFLESGRSGVILHPSMIYGAAGENNVQRLATLLRYLPVIPLPNGGKSLVQPIYQDDVTACILAALECKTLPQRPYAIVIAGAQAVPYWLFIKEITRATGLTFKPVITLPLSVLQSTARLMAFISKIFPQIPSVSPAELRRLTEDKAFDITDMQKYLGVFPLGIREGLAMTFSNTS